MNKTKTLLLAVALSVGLLTGCNKATLQSGGAYAPTNSLGAATIAPDIAFYQIDGAFDVAYSATQAVLKFELDNRIYLFTLDPNIKHTLDGIRPQIVTAIQQYGIARAAYVANPTPAGLTTLQTILGKAQQLASAASAVTANLNIK